MVHVREPSVGVEFVAMSRSSRKTLTQFLRACRELGLFQLQEKTGFVADLKYWWDYGLQRFSGDASPSPAPRLVSLPLPEDESKRKVA